MKYLLSVLIATLLVIASCKVYSDTCFIAEFGFYKLSTGSSSFKFYKAWRVFKKNSADDRPVGYYDDNSGQLLSFYLSL